MKRLPFWLLLLLVGGLYFFTLSPDVYLEDSGELIAAAAHLGIAHPSGYPLYLLLGKLFSWLPVGTVAFRFNLMSAVFGVGTALFLFFILRQLAKIFGEEGKGGQWLAFGVSLVFAVGMDFWSQAIDAEVYTLNALLVAVLTWIFLKWWQSHSDRHLYWIAFLSGLGITNHEMFAFVLPGFWALIFLQLGFRRAFGKIFRSVLLLLLGLSLYLYIPIRAAAHPAVNFANVQTLLDSLRVVTRSYYNDFVPGLLGKGGFVASFFAGLAQNFSWVMVVASILALGVFHKKRQIELMVLIYVNFVLSFAPLIFLRGLRYGVGWEFAYRVYYFQAYIFFFMMAYVFFGYFAKSRKIFIFAILILAATTIYVNFPQVDLRHNLVATYYQKKLESFPPNAVYLFAGEGYDGDSELFTLLYLQKVRHIRTDVKIVDTARLFEVPDQKFDRKDLEKIASIRKLYLQYVVQKYGFGRPLFAEFPVEAYAADLISRPTGWAEQILEKDKARAEALPETSFVPMNLTYPRQEWDLAYRDFLAASYYQTAMYHEYHGNRKKATDFLLSAIRFDNETDSEDFRAFQYFRARLTPPLK